MVKIFFETMKFDIDKFKLKNFLPYNKIQKNAVKKQQ